jgi:DNA-binding NtrC family response regulator
MAQTAFILIYSPDADAGQRLHELLRERHGHACKVVASIDDALDSVRQRMPDVVVLNPAGTDSVTASLYQALANRSRDAEVVAISANGTPPAPHGLRTTVVPPAADPAEYVERIGQIASKAVARREDRLLKESLADQRHEVFEGLVGSSPALQRIITRIRKIARNKLTVLILGETGSGKELIARAIHNQSDRARKPFLGINCAAFNENLLESELFGHVKGAFTGAVSDKKGIFVAADGGTLFLDEIGDMPLQMQTKLLRVLQEGEVRPVGGERVRRVDVRVVAATNRDLDAMVESGSFRADLFYRLDVLKLELPALRDRDGDVVLLARHLLRDAARKAGRELRLGPTAEAMLARCRWPGNIRQLQNEIQRVVALADGPEVRPQDFSPELGS